MLTRLAAAVGGRIPAEDAFAPEAEEGTPTRRQFREHPHLIHEQSGVVDAIRYEL